MINIGTSGWCYKHWMNNFYEGINPPNSLISWYTKSFRTVEINNSFYRLPSEHNFQTWHDITPDNFIFAVKAPRFITHVKKLIISPEYNGSFFQIVKGLGHKLGPILFQLPPNMKPNPERFRDFISSIPREHKYVFEFRNPAWVNDEIMEIMGRHRVHFCIHDMKGQQPIQTIGNMVYIRFHGTSEMYGGGYSDATLREWAIKIKVWSLTGKSVYCYFNNDSMGWAPKNAVSLMKFMRELEWARA